MLSRTVVTRYGLDVDRLLRDTPAELFEEWRTLYDMEPWGEERTDYAVGTVIAHMLAANGIEPKLPRDYMLFLRSREEQKPVSESDLKKQWDMICEARKREEEGYG